METLFWILVIATVYPYMLYPAVLWVFARTFGRHGKPPSPLVEDWPTASLLIVSHNEERLIKERIENALATDYPPGRLQIVIASDGSTDSTVRIAKQYADRGVQCIAFAERRGKAAALRSASGHLTGDVVVLSDTNSFFKADAVKLMARWFLEPSVGVVCGRLVLADKKQNKNCDGLYWRYETMLKKAESRLGALLGSNGAIYTIRRDLIKHLPANSIVDDFELPLIAKIQTDCAVLYEAGATANEETPSKISYEFKRRARIGTGVFLSLSRLHPLLNPFRGWIAFTFISHKLLRWIGPFLLVGAAVANAFLLNQPLYRATMLLQVAFYVFALFGLLMPIGTLPKVARLPALFVTVNAALLVGFFKWLFGRRSAVWQPTPRAETNVSGV